MTPDKIAKESEHSHQVAFFAYCAVAAMHGFEGADAWAAGYPFECRVDKLGNIERRDKSIPALKWIHAIHNQGHGDAVRGARAKAEGVKPGVADIFWPNAVFSNYDDPYLCADYYGLYIEMKKPSVKPVKETSKGGLSDEQIEFRDFVEFEGYKWAVCYSWQEAVNVLKEYLGYVQCNN